MPQLESGWAGRDTKPDFRKAGERGEEGSHSFTKNVWVPLVPGTGTRRKEKKVAGTEGDSKLLLTVAIQVTTDRQGTDHPLGLWQERTVGVQ